MEIGVRLLLFQSPLESAAPMQNVPFDDQRRITDDDFLEHLNLPGNAGKQLATAREAGDSAAVQAAVATHFRTRSGPRWPFYMHGSAWIEINGRGKVLEKADAILAGTLRSSWPPYRSESIRAADGTLD